jgi:hypothetical protein
MVNSAGRAVLAALLAVAVGCGGSSDPVVTPIPEAEQDLCSLAQAYIYTYEKNNKAPESFDELRPMLSEFGNPDDMRISPNDGQPYVVLWGCDPTKGGGGPVKGMWSIVAHEQVGADGKRAVADMRGIATTVTEEEFARLRFIGGKKKSSGERGK